MTIHDEGRYPCKRAAAGSVVRREVLAHRPRRTHADLSLLVHDGRCCAHLLTRTLSLVIHSCAVSTSSVCAPFLSAQGRYAGIKIVNDDVVLRSMHIFFLTLVFLS